jgi:hypothetical protein
MELAMAASTIAISRAGASSLAELAAMRLPAVLLPFPAAVDNHQFHNARAFEKTNAAHLLTQRDATADKLADLLFGLMNNTAERHKIQSALEQWHKPAAAAHIADSMLEVCGIKAPSTSTDPFRVSNSCLPATFHGDRPSESGPAKPAPGSNTPRSIRTCVNPFEPAGEPGPNVTRQQGSCA